MKHLLIVGNGSIGKRHARNLSSLDCMISVVDPKESRRTELDQEMPIKGHYETLEAALVNPYDGVFICTPPADHVEQCLMCIDQKLPIYLEKGVSLESSEAAKLALAVTNNHHLLLMGYTWRWWPSIQELESLMHDIGTIRKVEMVIAAHLADWHPWERYQDFYIASRGGVENESHWIDLMLKWFGWPEKLFSRIDHISDLETSTNDNLELWCEYDGMNVRIHFDLYSRPHEKYIKIVGEQGTVHWEPNKIKIGNDAGWTDNREAAWKTQKSNNRIIEYSTERNEMFLNAAKEFLHLLDNPNEKPSCTIIDGAQVMRLIEAARISHETGRILV